MLRQLLMLLLLSLLPLSPCAAGTFRAGAATADITPRRCQSFQPAVGTKVHWENWDYSNLQEPAKVAEGDVTVDQYGLVTIPKFQVGRNGLGNRLVLTASTVETIQPGRSTDRPKRRRHMHLAGCRGNGRRGRAQGRRHRCRSNRNRRFSRPYQCLRR